MGALKQRRSEGSKSATSSTTMPSSPPSAAVANKKPVVLVVGGGPAGAAVAKSLADKEIYQVKLFEGYAHPDKTAKNSPKAYVIALGGRGQHSLEAATGIQPQDIKDSILSSHLARHPGKKALNRKKEPSLVAPRQALTAHLLNEAEAAGVEIHFEHKLTDLDFEERIANFETGKGGQRVQVRYDLLVGCDGSKSKVRSLLDQHAHDFQVTRLEDDSMEYQVAVVPNPFVETHPVGCTHVWNDKTFNSICLAFPLSTGKMLFAVVFPEGRLSEFQTKPDGYDEAFQKLFPDLSNQVKDEIIQQLKVGTPANGGTCVWTSSMGSAKNGVVLVGDSAHGMWPSLGQGCNCALESAAVFCKTVDDLTGFFMDQKDDGSTDIASWTKMVVSEFNQRRYADAIAAVDLTYGGIGARKSRGRQNAPLSYKLQLGGMMLLHKFTLGIVPKPALLRIMAGEDVPYSTARMFNFYYEKFICMGTLSIVGGALYYWNKHRELS